jgi:hypothetical protein
VEVLVLLEERQHPVMKIVLVEMELDLLKYHHHMEHQVQTVH